MSTEIEQLYQELIIDHGTKPRNHCGLDNHSHHAEGFNPLCGDKVELYLILQNDVVTKATFLGQGCAIATASASMLTEILIGKHKEQSLELARDFIDLITNDNHEPIDLGKLNALASVKNFPSRVKCATLAWHTLDAALNNVLNSVSTE